MGTKSYLLRKTRILVTLLRSVKHFRLSFALTPTSLHNQRMHSSLCAPIMHRQPRRRAVEEKSPHKFLLERAFLLAEWTGLEPATPGVTGRYSNQLNYHSKLHIYTLLRKVGAIRSDTAKHSDVLASPRGFEPLYSP
jgi:hypothetical protein